MNERRHYGFINSGGCIDCFALRGSRDRFHDCGRDGWFLHDRGSGTNSGNRHRRFYSVCCGRATNHRRYRPNLRRQETVKQLKTPNVSHICILVAGSNYKNLTSLCWTGGAGRGTAVVTAAATVAATVTGAGAGVGACIGAGVTAEATAGSGAITLT